MKIRSLLKTLVNEVLDDMSFATGVGTNEVDRDDLWTTHVLDDDESEGDDVVDRTSGRQWVKSGRGEIA